MKHDNYMKFGFGFIGTQPHPFVFLLAISTLALQQHS